jgi:hypothetical protein
VLRSRSRCGPKGIECLAQNHDAGVDPDREDVPRSVNFGGGPMIIMLRQTRDLMGHGDLWGRPAELR